MESKNIVSTKSANSITHQLACHLAMLLPIFALLILLTGCINSSKRYDDYPAYTAINWKEYPNYGVGRFKTLHLVNQFDRFYRGTNPGPIGVATFVNVDDLYSTSTFGRVYAEQVMSELAMKGFDVVELRHSDALQFLSSTGEFALSRDIAVVRRERDLGGVVVGTYAVSPVRVYINARLIDPSTSVIHAAGSVEMPKDKEIARLLRGGAFPATLERIPVKHLGMHTYPLGIMMNPYQQSMRWQAEEMGYAMPAQQQPRMMEKLPPAPVMNAPQGGPGPEVK